MLLGVDVGGTFTDAALLTGGDLLTAKAPTTAADQSQGVMRAIEDVLGQAGAQPGEVERFVHGMTVGTNALLEGAVARTTLLATAGFTDLEELGRQTRPHLYRLCAGNPPSLVPPRRRIPVAERCGPDGLLRSLDERRLRASLVELEPPEAVAICLLWGFRHPDHERAAAGIVAELHPDAHVSTAHETAAVFREYERCATTIVDAALSPLLRRYLERLASLARAGGLPAPEVMLSSGGAASAATAALHGSWTVLSGPAGGATAAARISERTGAAGAVGLDMGGTSCDVTVVEDGRVRITAGREVGGRPLALPMLDVHTIGAGGGSIAWRDAGGALRVGPRSAGADPGPASYGRGGAEPTVTDADLVLGLLDERSSLGGLPLDRGLAEQALTHLGDELGMTAIEAATGIVEVATGAIAQAVRVMTVERGVDPRDLDLVAFGGAGPLHAAAIAEQLGMTRVVVPVSSGVLSALGLVVAERRRDLVQSVVFAGDEIQPAAIATTVETLAARGREELGDADGLRCAYDVRYRGQAFELTVEAGPEPGLEELRSLFEAAHERRYGYADGDAQLELVSVRVSVFEPGGDWPELPAPPANADGERSVRFGAREHRATVFRGPAPELPGPAICDLGDATLAVPPGWSGRWDACGALLLEREAPA